MLSSLVLHKCAGVILKYKTLSVLHITLTHYSNAVPQGLRCKCNLLDLLCVSILLISDRTLDSRYLKELVSIKGRFKIMRLFRINLKFRGRKCV